MGPGPVFLAKQWNGWRAGSGFLAKQWNGWRTGSWLSCQTV